HDMNVLVCNSNEEPERLNKYIDVMRGESVAGLIVVPTSNDDSRALQVLRNDNISVVVLDRTLPDFEADAVRSDNVNGAYIGVQQLIENGYRQIAIVYPDLPSGYERYQGYRQALENADIFVDENLVEAHSGHKDVDAREAMQKILARSHNLDAIFSASNLVTLGVLQAIREQGMRIPQDIALMGFDDVSWATELYSPLSTVAQSTYEIGQEAMRMLLQRLKQPSLPYRTSLMQTQLIIRESCGTVKREG
ncbi:MAG: substrate-binding domain-containing protein, partial [Aggregatilineales bacterium]